jgi:hypothetical protein
MFPPPHTEIEEKFRLTHEHASALVRQLDAGMHIAIPGWGLHRILPLQISRIIDTYYDTPERLFQIWSKTTGKQLLLRERQEGMIIGEVQPWEIQTLEEVSRVPIQDEVRKWVVKVPGEDSIANRNVREAREHEIIPTSQDRAALKAQCLSMMQGILNTEFDPLAVDVRECIGKVRKTYAIFAPPLDCVARTPLAVIDLDFILRAYYQFNATFLERYSKYEVEQQECGSLHHFEACIQNLRTVLHIPSEEPARTIIKL